MSDRIDKLQGISDAEAAANFRRLDEIGGTPKAYDIRPQSVAGSLHQNVYIGMPVTAEDRKAIPIASGVLDYFPAALIDVAKVSRQGNDQHNPGQRLHWARDKSTDQVDTIVRHLMERGGRDIDGMRHSAKAAWRCLALLQSEIEAEAGYDPNANSGHSQKL